MKKTLLLWVGIFAVSFVSSVQSAEPKAEDRKAPVAKEEKTPKPAMPNKGKQSPNPVVKIETNMGDIYVELDPQKAPLTVENFLSYTNNKFYNGTIFHRVIKDFMIQGGGMTQDMRRKKTKPPIKNEAANGLKNKRGTIAMARTGVPDSATSQFFINHKDNAFLDYRGPSAQEIGYAVFGKVVKGMDVVDAIAVTSTKKPGDVPIETVVIESVTVIEKSDKKDPDTHKEQEKDQCDQDYGKKEQNKSESK